MNNEISDIRAKRILWHDPKVNNSENIEYFQKIFQPNEVEIERFSDFQQAVNFLSNSQGRWIVITSGSKARNFIPLIMNFNNVIGRIIFCQNISLHKSWSSGIVDSVENLIENVVNEVNKIYDNFIINSTMKLIPTNTTVGQLHQIILDSSGQASLNDNSEMNSSFLLHDEIDNKKFLAIIKIFKYNLHVSYELILNEILNINTNAGNEITSIFNQKKSDLLEAIIYLYTTNYIFSPMNRTCAEQNYKKLKFVLSCLLIEIRKRPNVMLSEKTTLYRGLKNRNHLSKY